MSLVRLPTLAKGALSFAFPRFRTVHGYSNPLGTVSAESCYSVFLRHLVLLRRAGITGMPPVVAELGPGCSIGVGVAALLAGAHRYYALDLMDFTDPESDVEIVDQVASLFRRRAPIPASGIHSRRFPDLDNYDWPDWLDLGPNRQWEERVVAIRKDVAARSDRFVKIAAPWTDRAIPEDACVDWIISQSVLEHVDALQDG
jgi:hypothetical protein